MKKKALLLSDELFLSNSYSDGKFKVKQNKILTKLKNKFDFDNISSNNIDAIKATNYIKEFIKHFNYSYCFLSLKSYDLVLKEAVDALDKKGVKTIIVSKNNSINDGINKLKDIIDSKNVEYLIQDDNKEDNKNLINSSLLNLCK